MSTQSTHILILEIHGCRDPNSTLPVIADDPSEWGPIWLSKKPNMAEGSEVALGEMRLAKLAPRSSVYRDKTTVRHCVQFISSILVSFLEELICCFVFFAFHSLNLGRGP